ncbi:ECSIT protein, partial [Glaucidium brasilianum]|nr:ECSIT protein [Glaucidium brasilianum]
EPPDPERSLYYPLYLDLDLDRGPWDDDEFDVDEVEEGPVFALCMAGAGDRHTLGKWIAGLQETNPVLGHTPVIFRLEDGDPPAGTLGDPP